MSIKVRRLRLLGVTRDYDVSFLQETDARTLSVIAGEISTGKSSILEFIDYCLGGREHPRHPEMQRKVRGVLLEIELTDEVAVIERTVFSTEQQAFVHHCSLDNLATPHAKRRHVIEPAGDPNSLSTLLLSQSGLAGISLKEAPTKESSPADPLSFRDLMWLCFLPNHRLDNKQLLQEGNFMRQLKLRQVIEVLFGVHSDQLARLSQALDELQENRRALLADIQSLNDFLVEQETPERVELEDRLQQLNVEVVQSSNQLAALTIEMRARTDYAATQRRAFTAATQTSRTAASTARDRETLLRRLEPLRAQYAEDESKLIFFAEARQIFDPLRVTTCPSCLQTLSQPATLQDGQCTLCGQNVAAEADAVDVKAELGAVRLRRREIERYIGEVESQLRSANVALARSQAAEAQAQRELDNAVAQDLSPYVAQRDQLVAGIERLRREIADVQRQINWHLSLDRRRGDLGVLDGRMAELRSKIQDLQESRPSRDSLVASLSSRFTTILQEFGFPKLNDPEPPKVDNAFVPHVRGNVYRAIGSTGALTLISLAWVLSIFELAIEGGLPHPGLLLIDSPEKNLSPRPGTEGDEFANPAIATRVWEHILSWCERHEHRAQMIVVDNVPPAALDPAVVVRYSANAGAPPYGLIDDELP